MKKKNEMYAYLTRRDKKGVRFLGSFSYPSKVYPTKLNEESIRSMNMNPRTASELIKQLTDNRMEYELFFETAQSLEDLKSSLRKRGFSGIPTHQFSSGMKAGNINPQSLVTESSTMMRKGSSVR